MILCTIARLTDGVFPKDEVSKKIEESIQSAAILTSDYFAKQKEELVREVHRRHLSELNYKRRLAEINRNEEQFGMGLVLEMEGRDCDVIKLHILIGEKRIVVRFTKGSDLDDKAKVSGVIPKLKAVLSDISPAATFKDVDT